MRSRSLRHLLRVVVAALLATAALALPAAAQRVEVQGRGDPILDDLVRRFLADSATRVITRDTLLAAGDTLRGQIAAVGVSLRIEGVVDGALLIVDANVFVRPFGTVRGTVTNVAGGFWPSEHAIVDAEVSDHGDAPYDVERTDRGVRIVGLSRRQILDPDGFSGLRIPTYDRVAGLTLGFGATWYPLPRGRVEPRLHAWGGWAFEREDWVGGAGLALLGLRTDLEVVAERVTATEDAWIRGDLLNSLGVAVNGTDYRNYRAAERVRARLQHRVRQWTFQVGGLVEDAESLPASNVWAIDRPDTVRTNPSVDEGRIASALAGVESAVDLDRVQARLAFSAEAGTTVLGGDFEFGRYVAEATVAAGAFLNHTIEVYARAHGPLPGTDSLPRQRWGILGGLETLETLAVGELHGDRLALVRTTYAVPLDPFRVPLLGTPVAEAVHAAGSAWSRDGDSDLHQALGLRLHFPLLTAYAFIDPAGERDPAFGVAVQLRRRFPWEVPPL